MLHTPIAQHAGKAKGGGKASPKLLPFEVAWRSVNLLLVDMAASESLFCEDFFGRQSSAFQRSFRSVQAAQLVVELQTAL